MSEHLSQELPTPWGTTSTAERLDTETEIVWSDLSEAVAKSVRERQGTGKLTATDKAVRDDEFQMWSESLCRMTPMRPAFDNKVGHKPWTHGNASVVGEWLLSKGQATLLSPSVTHHIGQHSVIGVFSHSAPLARFDPEPTDDLLERSLEELRGVVGEAVADGFPVPGEAAINNAEKTLKRLYSVHPGNYTVCATEDGDVAIAVPVAGMGKAMTIECDSDGGLICFVNVNGHMRRMKDYDADMAWKSSDFIVRALSDLRA